MLILSLDVHLQCMYDMFCNRFCAVKRSETAKFIIQRVL